MVDWWNHWRLTSRYSLEEASYLILDREPFVDLDEAWNGRRRAVEGALDRAIKDRELLGELHFEGGFWVSTLAPHALTEYRAAVDLQGLFLRWEPLLAWLNEKNWKSEFFQSEGTPSAALPEYLDERHPRYSTELALAVKAWLAFSKDDRLLKRGTPKQALIAWLRANAVGPDTSKNALKRIATVANWKPQGGVPATPHQPEARRSRTR
jgi:hypothetical protein